MNYCMYCGAKLSPGDSYCSVCGAKIEDGLTPPPAPMSASIPPTPTDAAQTPPPPPPFACRNIYSAPESHKSFVESFSEYFGNSTVNFRLKDLFADVFKRHSLSDAEDIFICGTRYTTPPLYAVRFSWPRPWLYSRVLLIMTIAFVMLMLCLVMFDSSNAIPGVIVVGSFAMPLTTMMLFLELNAYRDVSVYKIIVTFLVGGCASLLATMILYMFITPGMDFVGAIIIGVVEEIGKLIIVYYTISRLRTCHILTGLLIGSAVGAGFAAFESAGYAFNFLLDDEGGLYTMFDVIVLRGILAPGGHVAWAAITGAAIVMAKGNRRLNTDILTSGKFLKLFAIPVVLHSIWDMPIGIGEDILLIPTLLTVAVWAVLIALINVGLTEVRNINITHI
ncbi:MAG: PrsW family intramembrane metalloprotease [Bacteroidales bacterium]|nr:PrsW family intramembrane metalloprotease [Bacteroidales bacterium]MDD6622755.1 PrsW family intramembrane metalloprotease [Bacteroidales bacterium]MDD6668508.1 PrsW family intramembrane metalloprotease [Bacteroidales bacterium]